MQVDQLQRQLQQSENSNADLIVWLENAESESAEKLQVRVAPQYQLHASTCM